jgi:hypothetical protein
MSEIWQLPTGVLYLPLYIGIITSIERVGGGISVVYSDYGANKPNTKAVMFFFAH